MKKKKQPPQTKALYPAEEKAPRIEQSEADLPPESARSEAGCSTLPLRFLGIFLLLAGLAILGTNTRDYKGYALIANGLLGIIWSYKRPKKEEQK